MTLLEWKSEYSVGDTAIDHEHREMIDLINTTYENLSNNTNPESIEQFLGEIYSSISAHFALEERVMQKANYPEYKTHKEDHENLLDQIREMMDIFMLNPDEGARLLQQQLSGWFGNHFASFDARLHKKLGVL